MVPLAFGLVGTIGSPLDAATFVMVFMLLVFRLRPRLATVAAAVVAIAEREPHVDDDRLADELSVDDREVEALRPTVVYREHREGER